MMWHTDQYDDYKQFQTSVRYCNGNHSDFIYDSARKETSGTILYRRQADE